MGWRMGGNGPRRSSLAVAHEINQTVRLPNIRRMADLMAAGAQADNGTVDVLAGTDGFAETYPEDNYTVVQHLQVEGQATSKLGDGANDALTSRHPSTSMQDKLKLRERSAVSGVSATATYREFE
jgi:hypothetical protein